MDRKKQSKDKKDAEDDEEKALTDELKVSKEASKTKQKEHYNK